MIQNKDCPKNLIPILDAQDALNGKWRLLILFALSNADMRFNELASQLVAISDKTLSKELKHLEMHRLIVRIEQNTFPKTVLYRMTTHGHSVRKVLEVLYDWGKEHRKEVLGKL